MTTTDSNSARDHFLKGYTEGYRAGYGEAAHGLPDQSAPYSAEPHPQVLVDGIEVDEGMRDLLVSLWNLGFSTQHSCQGHPDKFNYRSGGTYAAQIVFSNMDDAYRFLTKTVEMFKGQLWAANGLTLRTMLPREDGVPRADVTFSPDLLPALTERWMEYDITVN